MSKMMKDVLGKAKGEDKINAVMTGKGSFSKAGFGEFVSAIVNDTTYKVPVYDKEGKKTGDVNISALIRADFKSDLEKAKFPQKSEVAVTETCELASKGMSEAIPHIVNEYLKCGKKFDLPVQPTYQGSVYLAPVSGKTKTIQVRDPKTQENLGTAVITTKDSVQVRTKSPVPAHLQTKVRKDKDGKVVK